MKHLGSRDRKLSLLFFLCISIILVTVVALPQAALAAGQPTVTSSAAVVHNASARLNGNVTVVNDTTIDERGFVWDTASHGDPGNVAPAASAYASNHTDAGSWGTGIFYYAAALAAPPLTIYWRACAYNNATYWAYSAERSFTTAANLDRYWIGHSGDWGTSANWSLTSGGGGGAGVPGATNSAIFDASSFSAPGQTMTVNVSASCLDMDWSAATNTPTWAGSSALAIYGGFTGGTLTRSYTGVITFASTSMGNPIDTGGVAFGGAWTFNGAAGSWILVTSALSIGTSTLTLTNGTLNTAGLTVFCGTFASASGTNALITGASAINCSSWNFGAFSTTLNMGTSVITVTAASATFVNSIVAAQTYYDVTLAGSTSASMTNTAITIHTLTFSASPTMSTGAGAITATNLNVTGSAVAVATFTVGANIAVSGTTTLAGNSVGNRLKISGGTKTITSAVNVFSNVDFWNTVGAGAGSWNVTAITGGSADMGGNVGITFTDISYWVEGTSSWNSATGWSGTSGGTPNVDWVPVSVVNARLDANSFSAGGQTLSIGDNMSVACKDFDWTGVTHTPAFYMSSGYNGCSLGVYGSLTLSASMTWTPSTCSGGGASDRPILTFRGSGATHNITTNGVQLGTEIANSDTAGTVNLVDNCTVNPANAFDISPTARGFGVQGTFNMNSHTLSTPYFEFSGAGATMTNPGTIYIGNYGAAYTCPLPLNTYVTYGAIVLNGVGTYSFNSATTGDVIASLTHAPSSGSFTNILTLAYDITITGAYTSTGYTSAYRNLVKSSTAGTSRTITAASVSISYTDFLDITGAGATAPWNLTSSTAGDVGHNAGMAFSTGYYIYWVGNAGSWSDITHWASTSGGGAGTGRVPLPQDEATFDANSVTLASQTIAIDEPYLGYIDASAVLNNPAFSCTGTVNLYKNVVIGSATWSASTSTNFMGRGTQLINFGSTTITGNSTFNSIGGISKLDYHLTITGDITQAVGVLDLYNYNLTGATFTSTTGTRTLYLRSGIFTLNGTVAGNKWNVAAASFTVPSNTSTIYLTNSGANAQIFVGASISTYANLTVAGAGSYTLTITGSNTFTNVVIDRSITAKTVAFTSGTTTTVSALGVAAVGTTRVKLTNTSTNNIWTINCTSGVIYADYLDIEWCVATGGASFYAGTHSTIKDGTLSSSGGVVFGSPVSLYEGATNTPNVTTVGTLTTSMGSATLVGTASNHTGSTVTVSGSPKSFGPGATGSPITTLGTAPGLIDVVVTGSNWNLAAPTPPAANTLAVSPIGSTTAYGNAQVTSMGAYTVAYLFFQTSLTGVFAGEEVDSPEQTVIATGTYTQLVSGLTVDTPYWMRAALRYNVVDEVYAAAVTFSTSGKPDIATGSVINITSTTATLQGSVVAVGLYPPDYVYFQYSLTGVFGGEQTETAEQVETTVTGFTADIVGLLAGTTYYYRAAVRYVDVTSQYVYGSTLTFVAAAAIPPSITTLIATSIGANTVTLQGNLSSLGDYTSVNVYFDWGLTTSYGNQPLYQATSYPVAYNEAISGLSPNTTYHFRASVLYGSSFTASGLDVTFMTASSATLPNPDSGPFLVSYLAYQNTYVTGDTMVVVEYNIPYAILPASPASQTFMLRYIDTTGVVLQTASIYPYQKLGYGYGVVAFYWTAGAGPTWGEADVIQLIGNPTVNWNSTVPLAQATLLSSYWLAASTTPIARAQLCTTIVGTLCPDLQHDWNLLLTAVSGAGIVLNTSYGQMYFSNVIPYFNTVCASILTTSPLQPAVPPTSPPVATTYQQSLLQIWTSSIIGPNITASAAAQGVSPDVWLLIVFAFITVPVLGLSAWWLGTSQFIPLLFIPIFIGCIRIGVVSMNVGVTICALLFIISMYLLIHRRASV